MFKKNIYLHEIVQYSTKGQRDELMAYQYFFQCQHFIV